MSEQLNQEAESIISDESTELDLNLDDTEDVEALKAELARERQAKKQILARAKAAEEKIKKAPKAEPQKAEAPQLDAEILDLRLEGYTVDEAQFIKTNGGRKALENPFVKKAIETIREQKKAEQAIPDEDLGKSEIERKYTQEQLRNMSTEELLKILPKAN
jgi:hypothetical protein